MAHSPTFVDDHHLRIGTTDFYCAFPFADDVPAGYLEIMKNRHVVEQYIAISSEVEPRVIVELGINRGGSTALLRELAEPETLIALDIAPGPAPLLSAYVDQGDLAGVVRTFYGVDQSDRHRLEEILSAELGERSIDLVVDDASHVYAPTRASFEVLFPYLRPGGLFIIEDWSAAHLVSDGIVAAVQAMAPAERAAIHEQLQDNPARHEVSLTQLAVELVVARASAGDAIRQVAVTSDWVIIERGDDALSPGSFRLDDHVHDHGGFTTP